MLIGFSRRRDRRRICRLWKYPNIKLSRLKFRNKINWDICRWNSHVCRLRECRPRQYRRLKLCNEVGIEWPCTFINRSIPEQLRPKLRSVIDRKLIEDDKDIGHITLPLDPQPPHTPPGGLFSLHIHCRQRTQTL